MTDSHPSIKIFPIADYIIFHPDRNRRSVEVRAQADVNGIIFKRWKGRIFVDNPYTGHNEDPFVFWKPWVYSYCRTKFLRKARNKEGIIQQGSKLFFVSGNEAERGRLTIDTFFIVESIHKWNEVSNTIIPSAFTFHLNNIMSKLWNRHLKFPFNKEHETVTHTYCAHLWSKNSNMYSYLPINNEGQRVSIPFIKLPVDTIENIKKKLKGKFPVPLTHAESNLICKELSNSASIKVQIVKTLKLSTIVKI